MANEKAQAIPPGSARTTAEHIKETLESIVVAFILAFVFRAFVVEAFVIPTGSMASTLYGNQVTTTCSTCGFEYARGIDVNEEKDRRRLELRCPNCDTQVDVIDGPSVANPSSGDRILVFKWPFDSGIERLGPRRWGVTVFKDPSDGVTNFIKRLVGLPGEVLEIIDGDIYTASLDQLGKAGFPIERMDQLRQKIFSHDFEHKVNHGEIEQEYRALNALLVPHLKIQRKLLQYPQAQEALWVNVYNHDHLPNYAYLAGPEPAADQRDRVGWHPDDDAKEAWNAGRSEITFKSPSPSPLFLRFGGKAINNFSGYNPDRDRGRGPTVGDVRLRFTWFPDAGAGGIVLRMNRDRMYFTATLQSDGSVAVEGRDQNTPLGKVSIGAVKLDPFASGEPVEIEFVVVDYLVRLSLDGRPVIQSNDDQYTPDPATALLDDRVEPTTVAIGAYNIECRLRHVILERDVFYTSPALPSERQEVQDPRPGSPPLVKQNPYEGWSGWGTAGHPIMLRPARTVDGVSYPGEYFMLGDNSPSSKDSRLWWHIGPHLLKMGAEYQVGTVTGDQLIGTAFFVYWPAGYRPSWAGKFGFIPNFGQMRWIR